ncbi:hypothetical protein PGTUg99_017855 [Puccinia graminis f. sp. tritici]|uniref:Uncharacterized protein n=1 Tax=Puccinia graminis f. sp. tritici TaxID=56615 RepID=A0A5B0R9L9_PUCGR|nr:hypothetical protein PGTUg99_017855 [Puccinia graminis f. sp. tritici]
MCIDKRTPLPSPPAHAPAPQNPDFPRKQASEGRAEEPAPQRWVGGLARQSRTKIFSALDWWASPPAIIEELDPLATPSLTAPSGKAQSLTPSLTAPRGTTQSLPHIIEDLLPESNKVVEQNTTSPSMTSQTCQTLEMKNSYSYCVKHQKRDHVVNNTNTITVDDADNANAESEISHIWAEAQESQISGDSVLAKVLLKAYGELETPSQPVGAI